MSTVMIFDTLRSTVYSSITTSYVSVGVPFAHAMRILHFMNLTDAVVYVSFDGVTDNIAFAPNGFAVYDLTSDQDDNEKIRFQKGSQVYIKYVGTAPTVASTSFFVMSTYAKGE